MASPSRWSFCWVAWTACRCCRCLLTASYPRRCRVFNAPGCWARRWAAFSTPSISGCRSSASGGLSHQPPVPEPAKADAHCAIACSAAEQLPPDERERRQQRVISAARRFTEDPHSLYPLNPVWDNRFRRACWSRAAEANWTRSGNDELSAMAGKSTHEIKTWVAAFAALSAFVPLAQ